MAPNAQPWLDDYKLRCQADLQAKWEADSKIFAIQNRALRVAINCPLPLRTPDDCRACGNQECFEAWKEQNKLWPEKYEDHVCHAPFANTRRVPAKSSTPSDKKVSGTSPRPGQPASGSDLFTLSNEVEGQP